MEEAAALVVLQTWLLRVVAQITVVDVDLASRKVAGLVAFSFTTTY